MTERSVMPVLIFVLCFAGALLGLLSSTEVIVCLSLFAAVVLWWYNRGSSAEGQLPGLLFSLSIAAFVLLPMWVVWLAHNWTRFFS